MQLLAQDEQALVIHHKFVGRGPDRRIEDTIHFVPQLLYVIVPVEQHNEETKRKLRMRSHPTVDVIVDKALALPSPAAATAVARVKHHRDHRDHVRHAVA